MNNKAKLFVTYMFAIIDFETLTMSYTNAGHDPFYILKPTGEILDICERHGIPLGVRPNRAYDKTDIKLEIGDTLFFYTDGIPEAKNDKGEFYGMERLKNLLKECAKKNLSPLDIEKTIKQSVENFANGAEQFDDITLLCVKLNA